MHRRAQVPSPSPLESAVNSAVTASVERCIVRHGGTTDALIEILHALHQQQGWLSAPVLAAVARGLALPLSRVQGVASFYHLFLLNPPPRHRIGVCLGTACFVRGASALQQRLAQKLAPGLPLEQLSCIGACALAPVLLIDGQIADLAAVELLAPAAGV